MTPERMGDIHEQLHSLTVELAVATMNDELNDAGSDLACGMAILMDAANIGAMMGKPRKLTALVMSMNDWKEEYEAAHPEEVKQ